MRLLNSHLFTTDVVVLLVTAALDRKQCWFMVVRVAHLIRCGGGRWAFSSSSTNGQVTRYRQTHFN